MKIIKRNTLNSRSKSTASNLFFLYIINFLKGSSKKGTYINKSKY